jgi:hypothetical protein
MKLQLRFCEYHCKFVQIVDETKMRNKTEMETNKDTYLTPK